MNRRPLRILPTIVIAQFAGAAIWFSGNAVLPELMSLWDRSSPMAGWITGAVQAGFIAGTLVFALFSLADRFSPRWLFCLCAAAGAAANLMSVVLGHSAMGMLGVRFVCGFFLAGIYPVGMKIAAGWFDKGLGNALGFLIGALVLGTAFPHLLRGALAGVPWQAVIAVSSAVCLMGGLLMWVLVPDGPYLAPGGRFAPGAVAALFAHRPLRAAAFGYFGHMWELYALWAFVPQFLITYGERTPPLALDVPLWSFLIIGVGSLGCILGGMASTRLGSVTVARGYLAVSGLCCLLSPFIPLASPALFLTLMLVWGAAVVGDSPQFSAIVARSAPRERVGSALTLVNCIGFSITVASLCLLQWLSSRVPAQYLLTVLAIGPVAGLVSLRTGQTGFDGR